MEPDHKGLLKNLYNEADLCRNEGVIELAELLENAACYSRYRQTDAYKAIAKRKRDHYKDTLHDCYVRRVMAQHLGIKGSELPQTLVDAQRELMKLKRGRHGDRRRRSGVRYGAHLQFP